MAIILCGNTHCDTLRYGFGRHDFQDQYECLACSYYPEEGIPNQLELNAKILGLSIDEIKKKIQNNDLFTKEDLQSLFNNFTVPPDQRQFLKKLIGTPFKDALHGECGVFYVKFSEKHEPTPAPHIPSLAGITATIYYILSKIDVEKYGKLVVIGEYDAFTYPNKNCLLKKKRNTNCVCNDDLYQQAFREKWGLHNDDKGN